MAATISRIRSNRLRTSFFNSWDHATNQKKHLLYDTSHNLPRNEFIKETLNWLDHYLGPVQ